jgi:inorganic triphosphatase YgiF
VPDPIRPSTSSDECSQKEVELKLELPPASLPSIKQVPLLKALKPSPRRAAEISVYFDTDKYKLRKNGLMLRVRRIGHHHVQTTIKASSSSGPFLTQEVLVRRAAPSKLCAPHA